MIHVFFVKNLLNNFISFANLFIANLFITNLFDADLFSAFLIANISIVDILSSADHLFTADYLCSADHLFITNHLSTAGHLLTVDIFSCDITWRRKSDTFLIDMANLYNCTAIS